MARESTENHRLYDRMGLRTFYLSSATTPQDVNEVVNVLRTVFEIRFTAATAAKSYPHGARAHAGA